MIGDGFAGPRQRPRLGFLELATIAQAVEQAVVVLGLPFHAHRHGALGLSMRWPERLSDIASRAGNGGEATMAAVNDLEGGDHPSAPPHFWKLALGSVGVVYGDIGTAPSTPCERRSTKRRVTAFSVRAR